MTHAAQGLALYQTLNHQFGLGWCYSLLGDIVHDQADADAALVQYRRCLTIWVEPEDRVIVTQILAKIAKVMYQLGDMARAVRLMSAARAFREGDAMTLTATEQAAYDHILNCCCTALDGKSYRTAWNEGCTL